MSVNFKSNCNFCLSSWHLSLRSFRAVISDLELKLLRTRHKLNQSDWTWSSWNNKWKHTIHITKTLECTQSSGLNLSFSIPGPAGFCVQKWQLATLCRSPAGSRHFGAGRSPSGWSRGLQHHYATSQAPERKQKTQNCIRCIFYHNFLGGQKHFKKPKTCISRKKSF